MKLRHEIAKQLHRLAAIFEKYDQMKPIPLVDKFVEYTTKDSYEAAWYMSRGAEFITVHAIPVSFEKQGKYGYKEEWVITLGNVNERNIELYRQDNAQVRVTDFARERKRLKRYIRNLLKPDYDYNKGRKNGNKNRR